jgi:ribosome-associated heat shock protein Hsp15
MRLRCDKFIWAIRLRKTRSLASQAISKGNIKLNHVIVKPAKEVSIGDILTVHKKGAVFTYIVLQLQDKRIGANVVSEYIQDITPPEEYERLKEIMKASQSYRNYGTGKPSKKDRREIDDFLNEWI